MIEIEKIDHLVLTVANIESTLSFYGEILGMQIVYFGKEKERKALRFGDQKINLHQAGREFEPKAKNPTPGSADLCFITSTPIDTVIEHLSNRNVKIEMGPVMRTGAAGEIFSVYFRDPDENLIEVSNQHLG